MIESGLAISTIAAFLGLAEQTMRNWLHDFLQTGVASLVYRKQPGRPTRLTKRQKEQLKQMIVVGPEEAGYASACWTAVMIQELIQTQFGVSYSRFYLCECWAISVSPIKKPVLFLTI